MVPRKPTSYPINWSQQQAGQVVARSPADYNVYVVQMRRVWRPPTDVYLTDQHVVVKVEIAGMREDDFEISLLDRRLVIVGHRGDPADKLSYQNMEIRYGEFRTEVRVDWPLNESAIEATYDNGFLFVRLAKAKAHRVQVHVEPGDRDEP